MAALAGAKRRVERVGGVVVEVDDAVVVGERRLVLQALLQVHADLRRVPAPDLGQVAEDVVGRVEVDERRLARVEVRLVAEAARHLEPRRQVVLHGVRVEQRQRRHAQVLAGERVRAVVDVDRVVAGPERHLGEERRADHAGGADRHVVDRAHVADLDARQVGRQVERAVRADARAGVVRVVEVAAVDAPRRRSPASRRGRSLRADRSPRRPATRSCSRPRWGRSAADRPSGSPAPAHRAGWPGCGRARRRPGSSRWCWSRCRAGRWCSRESGCRAGCCCRPTARSRPGVRARSAP